MRELKFRAWDKEKKEYELLDSLYELQRMNLSKDEINHFEFEQYTGLKDKNGVEFCEGDILNLNNECNIPSLQREEVAYKNGAFICSYRGCNLYKILIGNNSSKREIIGNIHENPELCEETK